MIKLSAFAGCDARYELRFTSLFNRGRGYVFPCDAEGHVDVEGLTDRCCRNYQRARTAIGKDLSIPVVVMVASSEHAAEATRLNGQCNRPSPQHISFSPADIDAPVHELIFCECGVAQTMHEISRTVTHVFAGNAEPAHRTQVGRVAVHGRVFPRHGYSTGV